MDKKFIKKIVIVFAIILLIGIGIWSYKKIKNRNNDSKVVENENDIKAIDSLISVGSTRIVNNSKYKNISYSFEYKMYLLKHKTKEDVQCNKTTKKLDVYDIIFNLYVYKTENKIQTDPKKIESSWVVRNFADCKGATVDSSNSNIKAFVSETNAPITSIYENYVLVGFNSNNFIYTKVFDAETGKLIFDVPTNNLEVFNDFAFYTPVGSTTVPTITFARTTNKELNITVPDSKDKKITKTFSKNKYVIVNNSLYYLDTDYTSNVPSDLNTKSNGSYVKLNVYKVDFADGESTKTNLSNSSSVNQEVYANVTLNGEQQNNK